MRELSKGPMLSSGRKDRDWINKGLMTASRLKLGDIAASLGNPRVAPDGKLNLKAPKSNASKGPSTYRVSSVPASTLGGPGGGVSISKASPPAQRPACDDDVT